MTAQKDRKIYFDIMRIVATLAVMILHISGESWHFLPVDSYEWNVLNVFDGIVQWAVPVFVMISGALFLGQDRPLGQICKKNIMRIVTAFIFWTFFYSIVMLLTGNSMAVCVKTFFSGFYHLWFLFMIVGLYLLIPFFRMIVRDAKLTEYFLILSFVFAFVIPQSINIISLISRNIGSYLQEIADKFHMNFVLGFPFYFILGYRLDNIKLNKRTHYVLCFAGIAGFILTVLLTALVCIKTGEYITIFYDSFSLNVMMEAIFVFITIRHIFREHDFGIKAQIFWQKMSKFSFGAYLVHAFFISLLFYVFDFSPVSINPLLGVPLIGVIVFALSFAASALLNVIPFINKHFI